MQTPRNIGGHIVEKAMLIPSSVTATSIAAGVSGQTPVIDLQGFAEGPGMPKSVTIHLNSGATSSSPSVATVRAKLQDSDDGITFADYVPPPIAGVVQTAAQTAALDVHTAAADGFVDVDLSGIRRYVSLLITQAFTGGSSPAIIAAATGTFGGFSITPTH